MPDSFCTKIHEYSSEKEYKKKKKEFMKPNSVSSVCYKSFVNKNQVFS